MYDSVIIVDATGNFFSSHQLLTCGQRELLNKANSYYKTGYDHKNPMYLPTAMSISENV